MVNRCAILFAGAVVLAACASGSPASEPSPTASVSAVGGLECPSTEILSPDGEAPDLNGTWIGIGQRGASPYPGTYEFNQLNSCVAWVGRSTANGEEVGASWVNTFIGNVGSDFTISGQWAVVSTSQAFCGSGAVGAECYQSRGTLVLGIEFPSDRIRLVLQEVTRIPNRSTGIGVFVTGIWVRPGDVDLFEVPVD